MCTNAKAFERALEILRVQRRHWTLNSELWLSGKNTFCNKFQAKTSADQKKLLYIRFMSQEMTKVFYKQAVIHKIQQHVHLSTDV